MKSILFYINSMAPAGGIERVISTLLDRFSKEYQLTLLVKDEPKSFYPLPENVVINSLGLPRKLNMSSRVSRMLSIFSATYTTAKSIREYLKGRHFDYYYLVHPLSVLEFRLAGADMKKMVITEHGARTNYNFIYRKIKDLLYPKALVYVVPTRTDTADYVREGFPAVYVPHFRSELNYEIKPVRSKVVLNIGRFTPDKQQLMLLKAWRIIADQGQTNGWKLLIVGKGELESVLKSYVSDNNLIDSVTFLPPTREIEQLYAKAEIFALTSSSEGFGMVLLEAMSFGVPCISFDCPSGPRDLIEDNCNGFLVPLNDLNSFISKLLSLMTNATLRQKFSEAAFTTSLEWKDSDIVEKWYKIFK
ncbi:glycosyltransferase family 4 protein [Chitinophaga sp. 22536]|uniref:glycosyltransferase family 4 protein n=1 Tax=unclassified Chitinophaga TaxID=2619133 RepID=UPI003F84AB08